jgi:hypothetical protein
MAISNKIKWGSMPDRNIPNHSDTIRHTGYSVDVGKGHSHQLPKASRDIPISASVTDIAMSVNNEICKQVDNKVRDILENGGKDEWIAWFQAEVEHWKQRCEELEIELECMMNAFPESDHDVSPKRRGNF